MKTLVIAWDRDLVLHESIKVLLGELKQRGYDAMGIPCARLLDGIKVIDLSNLAVAEIEEIRTLIRYQVAS